MRVLSWGTVPMLAVGVVMVPVWPSMNYLGITPTSGQLCSSNDDAPQENRRQEAREPRESSPVSFARAPDGGVVAVGSGWVQAVSSPTPTSTMVSQRIRMGGIVAAAGEHMGLKRVQG